MQEKSLIESTEIFKIFRGTIPPYPPRYFALNILCIRTPFNETQLRAWYNVIRLHSRRRKSPLASPKCHNDKQPEKLQEPLTNSKTLTQINGEKFVP